MIAFFYPIVLIIVCTIYAVLTRKIPEAFNESKVWRDFCSFNAFKTSLNIYSTLDLRCTQRALFGLHSFLFTLQREINHIWELVPCLWPSVCQLLSVQLVCLHLRWESDESFHVACQFTCFSLQLYIILVRPERNVRQSMMTANRKGREMTNLLIKDYSEMFVCVCSTGLSKPPATGSTSMMSTVMVTVRCQKRFFLLLF